MGSGPIVYQVLDAQTLEVIDEVETKNEAELLIHQYEHQYDGELSIGEARHWVEEEVDEES